MRLEFVRGGLQRVFQGMVLCLSRGEKRRAIYEFLILAECGSFQLRLANPIVMSALDAPSVGTMIRFGNRG